MDIDVYNAFNEALSEIDKRPKNTYNEPQQSVIKKYLNTLDYNNTLINKYIGKIKSRHDVRERGNYAMSNAVIYDKHDLLCLHEQLKKMYDSCDKILKDSRMLF